LYLLSSDYRQILKRKEKKERVAIGTSQVEENFPAVSSIPI